MWDSKIFFMTPKSPTSKTVFGKLIQPLTGLVQQCNHKRKCNALTDQKWIETGLLRILSQEPSGRAFLQKLFDSGRSVLKRSLFFETLKSKRRLKLCRRFCYQLDQRPSRPYRLSLQNEMGYRKDLRSSEKQIG